MFFAIGPDFKAGETFDLPAEQIDIPKTIAELLGFNFPGSDGRVMSELFSSIIVD